MKRWRKPFAWYLAVALLMSATGYFGLQSEGLEEVSAASASTAKADTPMMSPIFAEKLEHSLKGFDQAIAFYNGTKMLTFEPEAPEPQSSVGSGCNSSCLSSFCLGSNCALSFCGGSECFGSLCGGSACLGSACGFSVCAGSVCGESICLGSACADCL